MAENIMQICRLCLNIIEDTNFEFLESLQMVMLKTVLVNLNISISLNPTICWKCADTLQKCFNFKTTCLNSEDRVKSFINTNELVKVKLEDVCFRDFFNDDKIFNGRKTCHLCFSLDSDFCTGVEDTSLQAMLKSCVPELNFDLTNESLVCRVCLDLLRKQYTFMLDCLESEKKIKMYSDLKGNESSNIIDLNSVRQFFENIKTDIKVETVITKFEDTPCDKSEEVFIKTELNYEILKSEEVDILDMEVKDEYSSEKDQEKRGQNMRFPKPEENRSNNTLEQNIPKPEENRTSKTVEQNSLDPLNLVKRFSCTQCSYSAKFKCSMESHMLIHKNPSELVMFQCSVCNFKTKRQKSLKVHLLIHMDPSERPTFKCVKCSYETKTKKNLRQHVKIHSNKPIVRYFMCNNCEFQTRRKRNLKLHMLQHDPTHMVYKCEKCNYSTKVLEYLIRHGRVHRDISEVPTFNCSICEFQTKTKQWLKLHMLQHDPTCEVYKCEKCNYSTNIRHYLTRHENIHKGISEVPTFKCNDCDFQTRSKGYLKLHNTLKHDSTHELYKCNKCNYSSKLRHYIKIHENVHRDISEVPTFKCNECGFQTRSKGHLKVHMVKHNPNHELYKCNKCNYSTKVRRYLKKHENIHKDISEVLTFKCSDCDFQTRSKGHLKLHMIKHKPSYELYKCNKCNYSTKSRYYLERHGNVHKDVSEVPTIKGNDRDFQSIYKESLSTLKYI